MKTDKEELCGFFLLVIEIFDSSLDDISQVGSSFHCKNQKADGTNEAITMSSMIIIGIKIR